MNTVLNQPTTAENTDFNTSMYDRQAPLMARYRKDSKRAWITDTATTSSIKANCMDPLHAHVTTAGHDIPLAVHTAVGGDSDGPVPGEILSAALAGCMDSTIRIIANRLGIEIRHLAVTASAEVDVRGTLHVNPEVPVGFQKMHLSVDLKADPDTKPELLGALLKTAEASCIVMQTLRTPPEITTQYNVGKK